MLSLSSRLIVATCSTVPPLLALLVIRPGEYLVIFSFVDFFDELFRIFGIDIDSHADACSRYLFHSGLETLRVTVRTFHLSDLDDAFRCQISDLGGLRGSRSFLYAQFFDE